MFYGISVTSVVGFFRSSFGFQYLQSHIVRLAALTTACCLRQLLAVLDYSKQSLSACLLE